MKRLSDIKFSTLDLVPVRENGSAAQSLLRAISAGRSQPIHSATAAGDNTAKPPWRSWLATSEGVVNGGEKVTWAIRARA